MMSCAATARTTLRRLAWAGLGLMASCGGGGPPDQVRATPSQIVGTATGGLTTGPDEAALSFSAKGTAGLVRASNAQANSLEYTVSLTELQPPYALSATLGDTREQAVVYSVAVTEGVANITPLTSLVIAQLYGQAPADIYDNYGATGSVDASRITPVNLAAAQAGVVAYLADDEHFTVPAAAGDFITSPFDAKAGDPMYDTVASLKAHLAAEGSNFDQLTIDVALAARLCSTEKISLEIGGTAGDFCPKTKDSTPRAGNAALRDDTFTDRRGNTLVVTLRGDAVIQVRYVRASDGAASACTDAGCAATTAGPVAPDLTRPIVFGRQALDGAAGRVVVDGALVAAIPGVVLPVLPCEIDDFTVVFSSRTVAGQCADPDPFDYGVGGVPGGLIGVDVSRGTYDFSAPSGSDPTNAKVSLITDGYGALLAAQFTDDEPGTFAPRRRFVCQQAGCTNVTLGPVTVNTDFGGPDFPFYVRTYTFADTPLIGVDDAGVPTGESATLRASLSAAYLLPIPPLAYPATTTCAAGLSAVPLIAAAAPFSACVPPGTASVDPGTADLHLDARSVFDADDQLSIVVHDGAVTSVDLHLSIVPGDFSCTGAACSGVTVSAPDASRRRTVRFDGTRLGEQFFGSPGPRFLTVQASSLVFGVP